MHDENAYPRLRLLPLDLSLYRLHAIQANGPRRQFSKPSNDTRLGHGVRLDAGCSRRIQKLRYVPLWRLGLTQSKTSDVTLVCDTGLPVG